MPRLQSEDLSGSVARYRERINASPHWARSESNVRPALLARLQVAADVGREGRNNEKDSTMRFPLIAVCTAVLSLAFAGSASAHRSPPNPDDFAFTATIDCGSGPIAVGSTEDLYAPLVDLETGRKYDPVGWDVSFGDFHFVEALPGVTRRNSIDCSYVDEWVSGTVTLQRTRRFGRDERGDHRGRHGDRHDDRRHNRRD
jgi:hypothetical protein